MVSCKKKEFFGTYVANHKEGIDTLMIKSNFTYKNIFISNNGKKYIKNERWKVGEESEWIDFVNFEWHLKGFDIAQQDTTAVSYWPVEVEYDFWGNPFLTIDADRRLKYIKKSSK